MKGPNKCKWNIWSLKLRREICNVGIIFILHFSTSKVLYCMEHGYYTPAQRSCWGGILVSVRLSVCPSIRPASVPRPSRIPCLLCSAYSSGGSISILYILSSNFRRCDACKVSCKILKFEFLAFFKICSLDFVLFWLWIWCESLVWVIMGRRGVSQNASVLVVLV